MRNVDKSPDAFRTISEVAADLGLPQHVLRFWETKFSQIKPLKRGGGRRYYRPDDVELLKGIRHLLYGEGYTIRGVQRLLKEHGVRFVAQVWREGAPQPMGPDRAGGRPPRPDHDVRRGPVAEPELEADGAAYDDGGEDEAGYAEPVEDPAGAPYERPREPRPSAAAMAQRFAPRALDDRLVGRARAPWEGPRPASRVADLPEAARPPRAAQAHGPHPDDAADPAARSALGSIMDRFRSAGRPEPEPSASFARALGPDEVRRLQATLFELLECKRLLDQVR